MNRINVTQHPMRTLAWWRELYRAEKIDMAPKYQRRSNLWGKWKRAHLIDSILNGFDVPKFYIADFNVVESPLNSENLPYAVIDGKQRLEAIFTFMDDKYALNASTQFMADPAAKIGGLIYSKLTERYPKIAGVLNSFHPVVMSVRSQSERLIEQMFVRLNSGVSINGAERRNAMDPPIPDLVREIAMHPFFTDYVKFSKDRMQEFNLVAKLLLFEYKRNLVDTKAGNLDSFVVEAANSIRTQQDRLDQLSPSSRSKEASALRESIEDAVAPYAAAQDRVQTVLERMVECFHEGDKLLGKQGSIPIYYWFLRENPRFVGSFRLFLEQFENDVMEAVRTARVNPSDADNTLLSYYNAARTTNDQSSLRERYRVILMRYKEWVAAHSSSRRSAVA